jgi:hypothetical protein
VRPLFVVSRTLILIALAGTMMCSAQIRRPGQPDPEPRLPNGMSQKDAILKEDHRKSLEEADELMKLSEELKIDLEKNDRHVLSLETLKKLDEMEKLVKRIRGRMKRN